MRLIRRQGKAMLLHQRWKAGAAFAVGALLLSGFVFVDTLDRHFGVSIDLSTEDTMKQKSLTPGIRRLFYPDDYVIGKFTSGGQEDYDKGEYKNAPVARKIGIIVHIIGVVYMLVGLNTVCDIYFCGALDEMVDNWNVQPDVAGATFMAAGGSAPELFTSLIGAVGTENDVGFGTIVGSAVFNVLAVIGCCGLAAHDPIKLTWWPLFRDCTFYIFGLTLLALFAQGPVTELPNGKKVGGGEIVWYEAIVLFLAYLCYCTIMFFNEKIEGKVRSIVGSPSSQVTPVEDVSPGEAEPEDSLRNAGESDPAPGPPSHHLGCDSAEQGQPQVQVKQQQQQLQPPGGAAGGHQKLSVSSATPSLYSGNELSASVLRKVHHHCHQAHHHHHSHHGDMETGGHHRQSQGLHAGAKPAKEDDVAKGDKEPEDQEAKKEEENAEGEGSEESEDETLELITPPDNQKDKILWILCLPIYAALYFCIPRATPRTFLRTFGAALCFIAIFSYFLVYCVEMFGQAILGGGNEVTVCMSFTLLAAGTSIPDLVSSMAVARVGEGDMAVSSSIGSNIFDILVGLPLPWVLKILVVEGAIKGNSGYGVRIQSPFIFWYVLLLLFMVACVIVCIMVNKWFLNKKLGIMMSVLYIIFLGIVLPLEITNIP